MPKYEVIRYIKVHRIVEAKDKNAAINIINSTPSKHEELMDRRVIRIIDEEEESCQNMM